MVFLSSTLPLRATAKREILGWAVWKGGVGSRSSGSTPLGGASGCSSLWGRSGRRREEEEPSARFLTLASSAELFLQWHVRPIENPFPKKKSEIPPQAAASDSHLSAFFPHDNLVCVGRTRTVCVFRSSLCPCAQRLSVRHLAVS